MKTYHFTLAQIEAATRQTGGVQMLLGQVNDGDLVIIGVNVPGETLTLARVIDVKQGDSAPNRGPQGHIEPWKRRGRRRK